MQRGKLYLTPYVVRSLYTEAMLLADEARAYFDMDWADAVAAGVRDQVVFSCESLKITTRLMHCIAWLLNQKQAADMPDSVAATEAARRPIGNSPPSNPQELLGLSDDARLLIAQSENLYKRLKRLSEKLDDHRERATRNAQGEAPLVHQMQARLQAVF